MYALASSLMSALVPLLASRSRIGTWGTIGEQKGSNRFFLLVSPFHITIGCGFLVLDPVDPVPLI